MFKKKTETFEVIRWDGENMEIVAGFMGLPVKKAGFGNLIIEVGEKEKVTIKKSHFAIKSNLTGKITSCDIDEFDQLYETAR